jgi:hypothetical protein
VAPVASIDRAAALAKHADDARRLKERFDGEERDPAWANSKIAELRPALERAAPAGRYEVQQVDCRKTICAAMLKWASYSEAQKGHDAPIVGVPNQGERSIYMPPPAASDLPYVAVAYYDYNPPVYARSSNGRSP